MDFPALPPDKLEDKSNDKSIEASYPSSIISMDLSLKNPPLIPIKPWSSQLFIPVKNHLKH